LNNPKRDIKYSERNVNEGLTKEMFNLAYFIYGSFARFFPWKRISHTL